MKAKANNCEAVIIEQFDTLAYGGADSSPCIAIGGEECIADDSLCSASRRARRKKALEIVKTVLSAAGLLILAAGVLFAIYKVLEFVLAIALLLLFWLAPRR